VRGREKERRKRRRVRRDELGDGALLKEKGGEGRSTVELIISG
jgi:hypothetical protein